VRVWENHKPGKFRTEWMFFYLFVSMGDSLGGLPVYDR
jgi:hypothetical protein